MVQGYRIGSKVDDKLNLLITEGGHQLNMNLVLSPDYIGSDSTTKVSSVKVYLVELEQKQYY